MNFTLIGLRNTVCFFDDFLTVSTRSETERIDYVIERLKKLNEDNLCIILQKCQKSEIDWVGYKFTQTGILPIESKTAAFFSNFSSKHGQTITKIPWICTPY